MSSKIDKSSVALKAKEIALSQGTLKKIEGLEGPVNFFGNSSFTIIYTTPFSGAEVMPGERRYLIDIYYKGKKVFSEAALNFENITGRKINTEWIEELMSI